MPFTFKEPESPQQFWANNAVKGKKNFQPKASADPEANTAAEAINRGVEAFRAAGGTIAFAEPRDAGPDWKVVHRVAESEELALAKAIEATFAAAGAAINEETMAFELAVHGNTGEIDWAELSKQLSDVLEASIRRVATQTALELLPRFQADHGQQFAELLSFWAHNAIQGKKGFQPTNRGGDAGGLPAGVAAHLAAEEQARLEGLDSAIAMEPMQDYYSSEGWAEVAGREGGRDEMVRKADAILKGTLAEADLTIRATPESFEKILFDGRFKSQFETNTSGGALNPVMRATREGEMFGYPRGSGHDGSMSAQARPIYGFFQSRDPGAYNMTSQYGRVVVKLRDSVRARTTVSWQDSLDPQVQPSLATHPKWFSYPQSVSSRMPKHGEQGVPYTEAQIHGGLRVRDIAEVRIPSTYTTPAIQQMLRIHGFSKAAQEAGSSPYDPKNDVWKAGPEGFVPQGYSEELLRFWAHNAVKGKKNFQPKGGAGEDLDTIVVEGESAGGDFDRVDLDPRALRAMENYERQGRPGTFDVNNPDKANDAIAKRLGLTRAELAEQAEPHLKAELAKADLIIRAPHGAAVLIIEQGRFKSQFESRSSKGMYDPKYRAEHEARAFGASPTMRPSDRPIYGYLHGGGTDQRFERIDGPRSSMESYGRVAFKLKDSVRPRTTWTGADSLNGKAAPSPINRPSIRSTAAGHRLDDPRTVDPTRIPGTNYAEIQVHGGVRLSDVASITLEGAQSQMYVGPALKAAGWRQMSSLPEGGGMPVGSTWVPGLEQHTERFDDELEPIEGEDFWPIAIADMNLVLGHSAAESYLRNHLPTLITQVTAETQGAIRDTILSGFQNGVPPRDMARFMRSMIGLTRPQARTRDRLFANLVNQMNRAGRTRPGSSVTWMSRIEKQLTRYNQKAIRYRALNIARTETLRAANAGQQALWQAATNEGLLEREVTRREWIATPSERTCRYCMALDGKQVGMNEPWSSDLGEVMEPPLHPSCRCAMGIAIDTSMGPPKPDLQVPIRVNENVPGAVARYENGGVTLGRQWLEDIDIFGAQKLYDLGIDSQGRLIQIKGVGLPFGAVKGYGGAASVFAHEVGHGWESQFDLTKPSRLGKWDPEQAKFVGLKPNLAGGNKFMKKTWRNASEAAADAFADYVQVPEMMAPSVRGWVEARLAEAPLWRSVVEALRANPEPRYWVQQGSISVSKPSAAPARPPTIEQQFSRLKILEDPDVVAARRLQAEARDAYLGSRSGTGSVPTVEASRMVNRAADAVEHAMTRAMDRIADELAGLSLEDARAVYKLAQREVELLKIEYDRIGSGIGTDARRADWATRNRLAQELVQKLGQLMPLRERILPRPTPNTTDPYREPQIYDDFLALQEVMEKDFGVRSRWSGLIHIDPMMPSGASGALDWSGNVKLNPRTVPRGTLDIVEKVSLLKTLTHEGFHAAQPLTSAEYMQIPGWEEGVVEMATQVFGGQMRQRAGLDPTEGYTTYARYTVPLEDLRTIIGLSKKDFYYRLIRVRLTERLGVIDAMIQEMTPFNRELRIPGFEIDVEDYRLRARLQLLNMESAMKTLPQVR